MRDGPLTRELLERGDLVARSEAEAAPAPMPRRDGPLLDGAPEHVRNNAQLRRAWIEQRRRERNGGNA